MRYALLRKMIHEERPNIVLTMPEDTGIYVILSLIGTKIPVYVSERNNPWVMPDSSVTRFLRKIAYPFATGIIFQTELSLLIQLILKEFLNLLQVNEIKLLLVWED